MRRPEGQGLNDLYVRFFRMAERRIADKTGRGVVCFISNYSWLDGLSFTGMREHFLEAFDTIRIDNLHGDRIISEYAPDGRTSETIMAIQGQSPGIKVGTAIALLSKSGSPENQLGIGRISYRDFHQARAEERRAALLSSLCDSNTDYWYMDIQPQLAIGLPFKPMEVSQSWSEWPSLPELFLVSFPGVKTSRDSLLIDISLDRLKARVKDYFSSTAVERSEPDEKGFIPYAYRPFDTRWLYWEANGGLLDRPRPDYKQHVFHENIWLEARQREAQEDFTRGTFCRQLADNFGNGLSTFFPVWLREEGLALDGGGEQRRPNLSDAAQRYLDRLGLGVEDLFHHALAVLHDPSYRKANAGALRMEWPRIPLPGWPDGDAPGAAEELAASAARGRELAALLDSETPVAGVTTGALRREMTAIAVPTTTDGGNMTADDFSLTVGWGHFGQGEAVMPGQGRVVEREYTSQEHAALGEAAQTLGATTFDVYLNDRAYWRNVPTDVWGYKLGGYQVLKKWLSYRDHNVLGRSIKPDEVQHFTDTARRIATILQLVTAK